MDDLEKINENGEIECHIAPIGEFNGSDSKGNPVKENLSFESLSRLADDLNTSGKEILCDQDHASCKKGIERDTEARGWFSRFFVDPIKGMFATLKLTRKGRELVEDRSYRFLSPTFALNEKGEPSRLDSIAMTNKPALEVDAILNSEPNNINEETIKMELTKDELVALIRDTVTAMNAAPVVEEAVQETVEEKVEVQNSEPEKTEDETVEEVKDDLEVKEDEKVDPVCNECGKKDEGVKNEEPEDENEEEPVKEEVIKLEALNTAPTVGLGDDVKGACSWKNLKGKAFFDWLKDHPQGI